VARPTNLYGSAGATAGFAAAAGVRAIHGGVEKRLVFIGASGARAGSSASAGTAPDGAGEVVMELAAIGRMEVASAEIHRRSSCAIQASSTANASTRRSNLGVRRTWS
jgi:hypothetical protein